MMYESSQNPPQPADQIDGGVRQCIDRRKHAHNAHAHSPHASHAHGYDSDYNTGTDDEGHFSDNTRPGTPKTAHRYYRRRYSRSRSSFYEEENDGIPPWPVKLRAETSRTNDCQMRADFEDEIKGLPKTTKPVNSIKFDALDENKNIHLWQNNKAIVYDTYPEAYFLLRGPFGAHCLSEVVGAASSQDGTAKYECRLARIVDDTEKRVVAIYEKDATLKKDGKFVFSIQWKVVRDKSGETYTLHDPHKNEFLTVTKNRVRMSTINEHQEFLQNPNAKIAIW